MPDQAMISRVAKAIEAASAMHMDSEAMARAAIDAIPDRRPMTVIGPGAELIWVRGRSALWLVGELPEFLRNLLAPYLISRPKGS